MNQVISMRCSVLASGSSGNAVYVEAGDTRILIDAGIGWRQLESALQGICIQGAQIDAILITHEHSDHIKGLRTAVKKWRLPVYTSEGTWSKLSHLWTPDEVTPRIIHADRPFSLGELVIEPFPLSHDAEEPLGFCVYSGVEKLVLATDLGYVSDKVREATKGAHSYILETNHDVEMLRVGPYPWHLKRRILGDRGHLSNDSAAEYLLDVLDDNTSTVYLAHLSKENNRPELARETLKKAILDRHHDLFENVTLQVTSPVQATGLTAVARTRPVSL